MLVFEKNIDPANKTLEYLRALTNTDRLERTIATDLLASNLERIHQDGKAVDGSNVGSYAELSKKVRSNPKKFGYSLSSRQVAFVDLFFTGKLHKDFVAAPAGEGWGVGFQSEYGSTLRAKQEKHFGKKIWGITAQDRETIERTVSAFISNPQSGSI